MNKYNEQVLFFEHIKKFILENDQITPDLVYSELTRYSNIPIEDLTSLWPNWINRYNKGNLSVFQHSSSPGFLWFANKELEGNEIKLYIPMKKSDIVLAANSLFDFLKNENMAHQSKISNKTRSDNVVVRVNNIYDANKVLNFIFNNELIKHALVSLNPFIPCYNGVGLAMDNNHSYNYTVATQISDFANSLKRANRLDLFNVDYFSLSMKDKAQREKNDLDLSDIYSLISKVTMSTFKIEDFYDHAYKKSFDIYNNRKLVTDPNAYFKNVLNMLSKAGNVDLNNAIYCYLRGDISKFGNLSEVLTRHVNPGDLINIMRTELSKNQISIPSNDQELIQQYLNLTFNNNLDERLNIIINAYVFTNKKYGYKQAHVAMLDLLVNGEFKCFTNDNDAREKLIKLSKTENLKKIILQNIDISNLNINDDEEIVNRFEALLKSKTLKTKVY